MKATTDFKQVIQDHLNKTAKKDKLFAETLKKENKNIDDCINYILNTVQKSGMNGFADDEIFNMAKHYYDEDDIKPGDKINAKVVINQTVELTKDDMAKAKEEAMAKAIEEAKEKLTKKRTVKKETPSTDQPTLF